MTRTITLALLLSALVATGMAQPVDGEPAGTLAIRAAVWGQVARPGQYFLNGSPDLFELLSAAGGPNGGADLTRVLLIRERDGSRVRLDVNRLAASGQPFFIVPGDVVIVSETFWSRFTRSLPVITTLAAIANLVVTVALVSGK
jgi:protein involved in polysaccharide export with SLBB domain